MAVVDRCLDSVDLVKRCVMEGEVMEQIKSRLAAATSAATELAKSLDALDEYTLQTLEVWLAKQEGELKCAKCRALMPRGRETSVCIACGCKRPPLPNTPTYDFKVSFAFLQFLETIHPPLQQSGSRKIWNPIVPIASESDEPETITAERETAVTSSADVSVEFEEAEEVRVEREVAVAIEPVQHSKEHLVIDENIIRANLQERPSSVDSSGMVDDADEGDDFGDFQDSAVEFSHEVSEDVFIQNGYSHSNQFQEAAKVEKEPEAVFAGAAVSSWDSEWDYPPSQFASGKTENGSHDNMPDISMDVTRDAPQVPEYDFSIFESFAENGSKEENVSPNIDGDAAFWEFHAKSIVNSRLASVKAVDRLASDISAFTTISDAESDSGDSSLEALPPQPPPQLSLDIAMEFGAYSGQNDLLESFTSPELVDFQRVAASSHPLATPPTSESPFRWMVDPLDGLSNQVSGDDVQNVEKSFAGTFETSAQVAVDPFPWPLEEFGSGSITENHMTTNQGASELMDTGRPQSEGNGVDPFSWPLDTFSQDMIGVDKDYAVPTASADVAEDETEDWGDEEFVWSEPAQFTLNVDPFPSSTSFASNVVAEETFMDKDSFFHDQSSPVSSVTASPNYGNGLESLVATNVENTVVEEDLFKSIHVKSLSFGDHHKKANVDDLSKRSVSFGNLQVNGDDLLKVLQTSSVYKPAQPAEDILNFLNLKPASSVPDVAKPSHVRSVSFDTVELVPDEQSDEMFQFFHTRSHSAGSSATKSATVENGAPSTPKTPTPVVDDDPFSFIHTAISPSAQSETVEVKADDDDDDDDFEWKAAEMPTTAPLEAVLPAPSQPDSIFEWTSSPPKSSGTPKSSGMTGLLSLAGGLPPSQIRMSSKEDDLLAALSRNSSSTGVAQAKQATVQVAVEPAHSLKLGDDSDDEFSDFVSTEAFPSAPPSSTRQPSQPAFDVSFFEAPQPNPSEKRNLDFFGDLMGLNFTNA